MTRNCNFWVLEILNVSICEIADVKWTRYKLIGDMIEYWAKEGCDDCCMAMQIFKEKPNIVNFTLWLEDKQ